jgi:parallel beta-helix repeat protein
VRTKLLYVLVVLTMVLSLAAAIVPAQVAMAATLLVGPGRTYATIQDAINAASPGDTIVVNNGVYREQVLVNKRVTLVSANGSAVTTINSSGLTGLSWTWNYYEDYTATFYPAVQLQTSNVVLGTAGRGFTITGADAFAWAGDPHEIEPGELPVESGVGVLDLASGCAIGGNNISANGWGLFEVYFWGAPNTIISGNTFSNNALAIYLGLGGGASGNDTVQNNTFINNSGAVTLEGTSGPTSSRIVNNTLRGNGQGIQIQGGCSNVTISGNNISDTHAIDMDWNGSTLTSNGDAINVDYWSNSNTVFNNTISTVTPGLEAEMGIHIGNGASNNNISSNKVSGCGAGIQIDSSSNNNAVSNNQVYNCSANGIVISGSSANNNIAANKVYNCANNGVWVLDSWSNSVASNTVYSCSAGIQLQNSNNIVVEKNNTYFGTTGTDVGIYLNNANNNIVRSNNVSRSLTGMSLTSNSDNNQILANRVSSDSTGIELSDDSDWNGIFSNDIRSNGTGNGISILANAYGTVIGCNNIVGNTEWGLCNYGSEFINAQNNWWGAADGPSGAGPGSGDALGGPAIDFSNWATSAYAFPDTTAPIITEAIASTDTISLFDTSYLNWVMSDAPYSIGPSYTKLFVNTGNSPCNTCGVTVNLSALVTGLMPSDIGTFIAGWQQSDPGKWNNWQNWMSQLSNQQMYPNNCNGNSYWAYDLNLEWLFNGLEGFFDRGAIARMVFEKFRPGQFNISVAAYDCSGNSGNTSRALIKLAVVDFQLPLQKGWNLRSTPITLNSTWGTWGAVTKLGNGMNGSVAMTWDAKTGKWVALASTAKINPLQAYYIYVNQSDQIGFIIERGVTTPPSLSLSAGWNLVGLAPYVRSFGGMPMETALSTIYTGNGSLPGWSAVMSMEQGLGYEEQFTYKACQMGSYWKWLQQNGWVAVPDGGSQFMQSGGGYWIFMNNPGVIGGFSYTPLPLDRQAPWLQSFDFDPDAIDTTGGAVPVNFTLHLGDEGAGFEYGWVLVSSPTGIQQNRDYSFDAFERVSGGSKDGIYEFSIDFSQYGEPGTWHVEHIELYDQVGNKMWLDEAGLRNMGFDTEIDVTCIEDITLPVLTSFTFTPDTIDTTGGPVEITFDLGLSDDVAGISRANWLLVSPSWSQVRFGFVSEPDDRISGTALDGIYEGTIEFPQDSETGTWSVIGMSLEDLAGNWRYYNNSTLEGMGCTTLLNVNVP